MNAVIARLRAQVQADRGALDRQMSLLAALSCGRGDPGVDARVALALQHTYSGVEAIIERCVVCFDGERPRGDDSHRALLESASLEIPGVRNAILSRPVVAALQELRSFRRFLHHSYAAELDGARLEALREAALRLRPALNADLDGLDRWLEAVAQG